VSTSGYYKWRGEPESDHDRDDQVLSALIATIFARRNHPGWRRIRAEPRVMGRPVGPNRIQRLMRRLGLSGRSPRAWRKTTVRGAKPVDAPDLIGRDSHADGPNQKWCGDITYIKTWKGWAYMATVIDLYSRKLVGWAIADHMETSLITAALDQAIASRRPRGGTIFHSDRGCQYTSKEFARYCRDHDITRSLGRTGICFDNSVAESFDATLKKELIHTRPWPDVRYLRKNVFEWVESQYNQRRRHSYLGYLTIQEYELVISITGPTSTQTSRLNQCPLFRNHST
jgi:transposase InsO family protein